MRRLATSLLLLATLPVLANDAIDPAKLKTASEAFVLQGANSERGVLVLDWEIAPEYYLYAEQFRAESRSKGLRFGPAVLPPGEPKHDEFFGDVSIHRGDLQVFIPFHYQPGADASSELSAEIRSQGCADVGVCYPPQNTWVGFLPDPAPVPVMSSAPALGNALRAIDEVAPLLPSDQAFMLDSTVVNNHIVSHFYIADGYYLYRDKFDIRMPGKDLQTGQTLFPPGDIVDDPEFGEVEVYRGEVAFATPIINTSPLTGEAMTIAFTVDHQGCAEQGLCYPPVSEPFELVAMLGDAPAVTVNTSGTAPGVNQTEGLIDRPLGQIILAMLGFGLLLAFTACMYPMIPILSGLIIGQGENTSVSHASWVSLVYVLSVALTFGVIGAITAAAAGGIGIQAYFQSPWLLIPFALLFVILALGLFGLYDLQIPAAVQGWLRNHSNAQDRNSVIGIVLMGVFSALIIGPCGGPVLIAALGYAAVSGNVVYGFLALFALGLGMGLPLLVIGAGGGKLLPKAGSWMVGVKMFGGVILLGVAIMLLERMPHIFSPKLTMSLWSVLLLVSGALLTTIDTRENNAGEHKLVQRIAHGLGVVLIVYGAIVMLGGLTGGTRVTDPFLGSELTLATGARVSQDQPFSMIKTRADLEQALLQTASDGKIAMLDFYADWCSYCKKYEAYVFPDARVQEALADVRWLKADVTATDSEDRELMQSLGVVLPPAILFFDERGNEILDARIIGELDADEFFAHIRTRVLSKTPAASG